MTLTYEDAMRYEFTSCSIPRTPTPCRYSECVYNGEEGFGDYPKVPDGICNDPRTNKGNGDALCHHKSTRTLVIDFLILPERASQ